MLAQTTTDRPVAAAAVAGRDDGGAFITLPQVYTEDADRPGWRHSNLGMYRVQLSGNQYAAEPRGRPALSDSSRHRRASCRGDSPRRAVARQYLRRRAAGDDLAAVMPLPEGLPELAFAGALGGRRMPHDPPRPADCRSPPRPISASPARSIPSGSCPKARSAITWATTAWRTIFRC